MTDPMTDADRLDAIEARASAATNGPWRVWRDHDPGKARSMAVETAWCHGDFDGDTELITDYLPSLADAMFVAAAREDVPWLVAEVRRLRAQLDAVPHDPPAMEACWGPTTRLVLEQLRAELEAEPRPDAFPGTPDGEAEFAAAHRAWDGRVTAWRTVLGPMLINEALRPVEGK